MTHDRHTVSRRRFVQASAASSLALAGLGFPRTGSAQAAKPNIVFILADDLGYADVSCYGQRDYTTPNVDRLAIEGLRFTQGYSNSANCSPTRTGLITGRYQMRLPVGLEEPINASTPKNVGLPPSHPTLPSLLKQAGYGTSLVGKWHLGYLPDYSPLKSGYEVRGLATSSATRAGIRMLLRRRHGRSVLGKQAWCCRRNGRLDSLFPIRTLIRPRTHATSSVASP
jgi:hypothetical protein